MSKGNLTHFLFDFELKFWYNIFRKRKGETLWKELMTLPIIPPK